MKLSTLGLMRKVGCLVFGFDAVGREITSTSSDIAGILITRDLSVKTRKELEFLRDKHKRDIKIVELDIDMDETEKILGKRTGIIAVMEEGFWRSAEQ